MLKWVVTSRSDSKHLREVKKSACVNGSRSVQEAFETDDETDDKTLTRADDKKHSGHGADDKTLTRRDDKTRTRADDKVQTEDRLESNKDKKVKVDCVMTATSVIVTRQPLGSSDSSEANDSLLDNTDDFSDDSLHGSDYSETDKIRAMSNIHYSTPHTHHHEHKDSGFESDINPDLNESCYNSEADNTSDTTSDSTSDMIITSDITSDTKSDTTSTDNMHDVAIATTHGSDTKTCTQTIAEKLAQEREAINTIESSSRDKSHTSVERFSGYFCEHNISSTLPLMAACNNNNITGYQTDSDNNSTDASHNTAVNNSDNHGNRIASPSDTRHHVTQAVSRRQIVTQQMQKTVSVRNCQSQPNSPQIQRHDESKEFSQHENIHQKRSRLVEQIDRELKLKIGAENLYKASENRRLRETIQVEIRFIDSHIKLLTDQLTDQDFNMESKTANNESVSIFPMIQLGFKETKDIDSAPALKSFITRHYFENGEDFESEIDTFENIRQLTRTPVPNEGGIELLFEYYNQLYFIDKRFFGDIHRKPGVHFEWHDSINGKLTVQNSVGFEKGCQLFNIGALYSHIAAHQRRTTEKELSCAQESFQKAAGVLQYLEEHFAHAPSTDMQPHMLKILNQLMLCQAQECCYDQEKLTKDAQTIADHVTVAQHSALLYDMYRYVRQLMNFDCVKEYVPHSWHILVQVKTLFFKAISNFHAANAIILTDKLTDEDRKSYERTLEYMFEPLSPSRASSNRTANGHVVIDVAASRFLKPGNNTKRKYLVQSCLSRAVLSLEDALRIHKQHQRLKRIPYYHDVHQLLKQSHDQCFQLLSQREDEDDFTQLSIIPNIKGKCSTEIKPLTPDFSKYKVNDLFKKLGPLAIFCSKHAWSAPLRLDMRKKTGQGYGFSVRGDAPVIVAEVDDGSLAQKTGMRAGDFIVQIDNRDVRWSKHEEVVKLIRAAGQRLVMSLITPLDKNYLKPRLKSESSDDSERGSRLHDSERLNQSRPRQRLVNSRSLDRTLDREEEYRASSKSTHSLSRTLKKLRGRQKQRLG